MRIIIPTSETVVFGAVASLKDAVRSLVDVDKWEVFGRAAWGLWGSEDRLATAIWAHYSEEPEGLNAVIVCTADDPAIFNILVGTDDLDSRRWFGYWEREWYDIASPLEQVTFQLRRWTLGSAEVPREFGHVVPAA